MDPDIFYKVNEAPSNTSCEFQFKTCPSIDLYVVYTVYMRDDPAGIETLPHRPSSVMTEGQS